MEPLDPKEAVKMLEEPAPTTAPPQHNGDRASKEAQLLGSTREAIALRRAEIEGNLRLRKAELKGEIDTIKARETAKEKAGKHLAVFGALYLCILVLAFLVSVQTIDGENLAIVATLITLVVTSLSGILRGISEEAQPADPTELMHDIVMRQIEDQYEAEE